MRSNPTCEAISGENEDEIMRSASSIAAIGIILFLAVILDGCTQGYIKRNNEITFHGWNEAHGSFEHVVQGADFNSFIIIDDYFAKDKNQAYAYGWPLKGSDPATFEVLGNERSRDKDWEYWGWDNRVKVKPKDFTTEYRRKDDYIIFHGWSSNGPYDYKLKDVDYASFSSIGRDYAKDKKRAYFEGLPINGVDVGTFVVLAVTNDPWAKDKNWYYRKSFRGGAAHGEKPYTRDDCIFLRVPCSGLTPLVK